MGEVISVVVGKIVHLLFSAVTHEINYARNCTKNIDKLRNEAHNLKDMKGRIQQRIDVAKDKGERLLEGHLEDGNKHFETGVSVPITAPSIVDLYQRKNLEHMYSQKFTLGKIIQALEDENIQTVGIYGLGGVGKTTIAKEVAAKMKNQFADLEILKLRGTGTRHIPKEIGQLTNLRLLDVDICKSLSYVTPGVISKLKFLETLHIGFFLEQDGKYNCIRELVKKLIQASDVITLEWIKHLDNIVPALYPKSFDELKYICLRNCHNVSCLVKTRDPDAMDAFVTSNDLDQGKRREKFFSQVEEILLEHLPRLELLWDCPNQYISFHNLVKIKIIRCSSLDDIPSGEQKDSSETKVGIHDADIVFPCLTNLVLCDLPKLKIFYSGHSTINILLGSL
nr:hypothetical protein [Tanacetum cinerariifolium]